MTLAKKTKGLCFPPWLSTRFSVAGVSWVYCISLKFYDWWNPFYSICKLCSCHFCARKPSRKCTVPFLAPAEVPIRFLLFQEMKRPTGDGFNFWRHYGHCNIVTIPTVDSCSAHFSTRSSPIICKNSVASLKRLELVHYTVPSLSTPPNW